MPCEGCLVGEPSEDMGAQFRTAGFLREAERLNEVPLGQDVLPIVEGHPAHQVELLGTRFVERPTAVAGGVVRAEQGRDGGGQVGGKLLSGVAASSHDVQLLEDAKGAADRLDVVGCHLAVGERGLLKGGE